MSTQYTKRQTPPTSVIPARASRIATQEHKLLPTAGYSVGIHPEDTLALTENRRIVAASPTNDKTQYGTRTPNTTRRYDSTKTKVIVHDLRKSEKSAATQKKPLLAHVHWSVVAGGAALVTIALVYAGSAVHTAYENYQDDLHYGTPRTYQVDEVVGHHDSSILPSHFIAMNLHSHIRVIELPGQDSSKAKIYDGPTLSGTNTDRIPVTLEFKDINHDGKLDMIVATSTQDFTYLNDGEQFLPVK
ncbi:hypothetical protein [Dictyobacter kobayashii]|uniref:VCBS repeat-containing protein n=1 Tax=Dictyobacter kobayashii TaxID=2014872 RepID=A0A402AKD0_9CHLR|nr:hypothetical protein [Dictyobacter kobayashii]GCE19543.1 hypothetical protein KDK_33430 [Dictyobacter kobayashii]